ncbi:MAG TPA: hypothetical protein VI669_10665 [Vicinamibacteria bacterium]
MQIDAAWRTGIVKCVEFYVRSAALPRNAYALGSTLIDSSDRQDSWAGTLTCRICNRIMIDLPPIDQPETGWPDVVVMICDEGSHSVDEA